MFDFECDAGWNVGQEADALTTSLFGAPQKKKRKQASQNGKKVVQHSIGDSDDETFSKKGIRKLKKKRKQMKQKGGNLSESMVSWTDNDLHTVKTLDKSERKRELKTETSNPLTSHKQKSNKQGDNNKNHDGGPKSAKEMKKTSDKKRKRASSEVDDEHQSTSPPNKKAKKFAEDRNTSGDSGLVASGESQTKKRRRNRKKKNNSKKNKYAHLALNRKGQAETNQASPVAIQSKASTASTSEKAAGNSLVKTSKGKSVINIDDLKSIGTSLKTEKTQKHHPLNANPLKTVVAPDISNKYESSEKFTKKKKRKSKAIETEEDSQATFQNTDSAMVKTKRKGKEVKGNEKSSGVTVLEQAPNLSKTKEADTLNSKMPELKQKQNTLLKLLSNAEKAKNDKSKTKKKEAKNKKSDSSNSKETNIISGTPINNKRSLNSGLKVVEKKTTQNRFMTDFESLSSKLKENDKTAELAAKKKASLWGNKATDLGSNAREKLNAARFRYLNEQLYTCTGSDALQMFQEDGEAFKVYHAGFENQVVKWPINPVEVLIKQLKLKSPDLVVADFGCGDAKLAQHIPQKVHSFDLVALNSWVTACDMTKVPLPGESVDIAVFCLSLMGTNLDDYVREANRVLKTGGLLKIVEVVSRFHGLSGFLAGVCGHGFQLLNKRDLSQMFYLMDFRKMKPAKKTTSGKGLSLKPCIYKRR